MTPQGSRIINVAPVLLAFGLAFDSLVFAAIFKAVL
ncbi:hypothetical protein N879_11880 [Alcaligenes sp. EGD-AK7]|nr:hypothetical protein N879_11880 [Alcaligenes sp. EGD-AK7]